MYIFVEDMEERCVGQICDGNSLFFSGEKNIFFTANSN